MKKRYASPTVQMMAFRYRDQVVAASGVSATSLDETTTDESSRFDQFLDSLGGWGDVIRDILDVLFG